MIFAVLSLGALAALYSALCIVVIGFLVHLLLVHLSVKRKVFSSYRFLVVMVLIVPVYLIYDVHNDGGMVRGMLHYVVSAYLITAVIISVLWRIIGYYFSEERE